MDNLIATIEELNHNKTYFLHITYKKGNTITYFYVYETKIEGKWLEIKQLLSNNKIQESKVRLSRCLIIKTTSL